MLPIVAIVGRPNVGKSTFFNRLTKKRNALVDDIPGVTRDRLYATVRWDERDFILVDTGGFDSSHKGPIWASVKEQVETAIKEAHLIIVLFDGRAGPVLGDKDLLDLLRRSEKSILCAANKIDGPENEHLSLEFYALGIDNIFPISSAHGYGIGSLMEQVIRNLPDVPLPQEEENRIRIAIIGRPNVGKSSLINKIIGSERLVVSELAGTTRDSVDISFEREGKSFLLIDTAGIRRRGRVTEKIEKISIIKALNAIDRCHISLILLDANEGVYDQDVRICGYAYERGRGMIMAFNKWDLVKKDSFSRKSLEIAIERQLEFISFVPRVNISALTGEKVHRLFGMIDAVWSQYNTRVPTPDVNRVLEDIIIKHPPPMTGGKRVRLFYATQVSVQPPTFVVFVNRPDGVHQTYEKYLVNQFRDRFGFDRTPIKIYFKKK